MRRAGGVIICGSTSRACGASRFLAPAAAAAAAADEPEALELEHADVEKEEEDGDVGAGEEDDVSASDGRDGAAGADDGREIAAEHVENPRDDPAGDVEREIGEVAHLVVDVVAEDVEKQHVSRDVGDIGMQEGIGEEAQHRGMPGAELQHGREAGEDMLKQEHEHVGRDEAVVHPRRGAQAAIGADGDHVAGNSETVKQ